MVRNPETGLHLQAIITAGAMADAALAIVAAFEDAVACHQGDAPFSSFLDPPCQLPRGEQERAEEWKVFGCPPEESEHAVLSGNRYVLRITRGRWSEVSEVLRHLDDRDRHSLEHRQAGASGCRPPPSHACPGGCTTEIRRRDDDDGGQMVSRRPTRSVSPRRGCERDTVDPLAQAACQGTEGPAGQIA